MSNTVDDQAARPERGRAGRGKTALVSVLILLAGVALMVLIFETEPTATRGDVARETAMLVEVRSAERGRFTPVIEVMGQVVPAREVTLQPRVSGRVIELAEAFEPGGRGRRPVAPARRCRHRNGRRRWHVYQRHRPAHCPHRGRDDGQYRRGRDCLECQPSFACGCEADHWRGNGRDLWLSAHRRC